MRRAVLATVALVLCAADAPPEPRDYRMDDYRAPTPATMNGRPAVSTEEAERLWRSGAAVFIDTLPRAPRPAGLPAGTLWRPRPREDIPGSVWLPDTGYGVLPPMMERYFADGVQQATHADLSRRVVFYCLADCWMSWNAARRAAAMGYANAEWYRDGTDGWAAHGLPLEPRQPVSRPGE